jgi:hypothetical protein
MLRYVVQDRLSQLILKRAPVGDNQDDYSVLEEGVVVGRIFKAQVAPEGPLDVGERSQWRQRQARGLRL